MKNLIRLLLVVLLLPVMFLFNGCGDTTEYGDWIRVNDFSGVARSDAASFVIGTKGYVFGGYDGSDRLCDLWEYDTETDSWTQMQSLNEATGLETLKGRNSSTAFAVGTKGYVGLGYDGKNYLKDFYEYNSETDTWTRIEDFMGPERVGAVAFTVGGKGYAGTGFNDNYLNDFYCFDPSTGHWTKSADILGEKRYNGAAFVYNNEGYVVGGMNNLSMVTGFCKFNPSTGKWIELRAIADESPSTYDDGYDNLARQYPLIFVIDDKAYMTCGANRSGTLLSDAYEYNFVKDRWYSASAFEGTTRTQAVSMTVANRGFILTGRSSTYRFDDVWEFLPDQEYDSARH
jgi:N-acetylneuraminic acid mutarotase